MERRRVIRPGGRGGGRCELDPAGSVRRHDRPRSTRVAALALLAVGLIGYATTARADGALVRVDELHLVPALVTIAAGETVTFHWVPDETLVQSGQPIRLVAEDGSWRSPPLEPGDIWRLRIDRSGLYGYHLEDNSSIEGEIVVE